MTGHSTSIGTMGGSVIDFVSTSSYIFHNVREFTILSCTICDHQPMQRSQIIKYLLTLTLSIMRSTNMQGLGDKERHASLSSPDITDSLDNAALTDVPEAVNLPWYDYGHIVKKHKSTQYFLKYKDT